MRKIIFAVLLCTPLAAFAAGHMDVIKMELKEGCSLAELVEITADFNQWGADYGYHARIAAPLQNDDLTHLYWLGESANAATFGAAWDAWRDAQSDVDTAAAQLGARFDECATNISRTGYDLY